MEDASPITSSISPSNDEGPSSSFSGGPSRLRDLLSEERAVNSPELVQQQSSMSYRVRHSHRQIPSSSVEDPPTDDTLSCVIVILTFWFFGNFVFYIYSMQFISNWCFCMMLLLNFIYLIVFFLSVGIDCKLSLLDC